MRFLAKSRGTDSCPCLIGRLGYTNTDLKTDLKKRFKKTGAKQNHERKENRYSACHARCV